MFFKAQSAPDSPLCPVFQTGCNPAMDTFWGCTNTSTFCCVTLAPKQQDFFHCRRSVLHSPSQTYGISQSKCDQSHQSPLFARSLLWSAHHSPSALCQSLLEHNFVFCLLFTHFLELFSTQTCETVPGDEVVICKLQAPSITPSTQL